ncbi:MAG: hypothetical protein JWL83_99 [Actinomycetia bacterium]|nr:hypothetical protein [Actinomycetes bacterium]
MTHARLFISLFVCALLGCVGVLPSPASAAARASTPRATAHVAAVGSSQGYWLDASDGGVFSFGSTTFHGSTGARALNKPVVGMAPTPSGNGYWLVATDGGIFNFGDANFRGSTGAMTLNKPIVGMAATPSGSGYWLVASDGGIFGYGDAHFHGSTGALALHKPIVGMASTPSGKGYWLVASDGGIFNFGDAHFHGSTGAMALNKPIAAMTATPSGNGYWLVATDGGIFNYGDAAFHGSTGAMALNQPIVGMASTPSGNGYWLVATDGGIFNYGDAYFRGSTGALALHKPIVGMAAITVGSTPLEATKLGFTTQPGNSTGGIAFARQPSVTVQDAASAKLSDATTHVTLALASGGAGGFTCTGGLTRAATNGVANFAGCKINHAGPYTLSATASGLSTATSHALHIGVGAPASLVFSSQPGGAINNASFVHEPIVTVVDAGGNTVTDFTDPITLAITGGGATLGCASNTVTAIAGVATFTGCDINTIGDFTLTATSAGDITSPPSDPVPVTGPATKLAFGTQPSTTGTGGTTLGTQPVVLVQDAAGRTVSADQSTVTLALTVAAGARLSCTAPGIGFPSLATKAAVDGVATFANCKINRVGSYSFTATDATPTALTPTISTPNTTITVGTAARLEFTTSPSISTVAGIAFLVQPVVAVVDAGGNVTADTPTVALTIATGGAGGLTCAAMPAIAGVATFTGCKMDKVGTYTLIATTLGGLASPVPSDNVEITESIATTLAFSTQPSSSATSGTAFTRQPVVTIQDAFGNTTTTDTSNVTLVPSGGTLGCAANTVAAVAGIAAFAGCDINLVGTYTLTASDGVLTPAVSDNVAIGAGAAAQLVFTTSPSGATGGTAFGTQPVVTVEDAAGNTATSDNTSVVALAKATGPSGTLTCAATQAVAGVATFAGCKIDTAGTYTLTATNGVFTSPASSDVVVGVGTATSLALTVQPVGAGGGSVFGTQPVVTAKDAGGNTVSNTNVVTFTKFSGPANGTLSACSVAAVGGVATFTGCKIDLVGTYTLKASDGNLTSAATGTVVITIGTAASLLITTQPSDSLGGVAFGIQPVVKIRDAGGNIITGDNTSTVTLAKASGPSGGILTCTPVVAVAGIATFAGCKIDLVGTYTLTAGDGTRTSPASSPVAITVGGPAKLGFINSPSNSTGGIAFGTQPAVAIQDTAGNTVTTNTSTVTLAITGSDGPAVLTCTGGLTKAAAAGVATFAGCNIDMAGTYTLTAIRTDPTTLAPAVSDGTTITVGVAAKLGFTTQPGNSTGGVAFNPQPVVKIQDAGGNTIPGDTSDVTLALTSAGGATFTCVTNPKTATAGVAAFGLCKIDRPGHYTLTATDTSPTLLAPAVSNDITIVVGSAARLHFATSPSASTGGTAFTTQPVVTIQDAGGNTIVGNTSVVSLAIGTGGAGVLTCVATAAVAGVATFTACKIDHPGTYTLTATNTGELVTAESDPVAITLGLPTHIGFTSQPVDSTGGVAFGTQPVVKVQDAGGNTITTDSSNVVLSLTAADGATLTCTSTGGLTKTAAAGVATFAGCKIDHPGSYTLTATDGEFPSIVSNGITITVGLGVKLFFSTSPSASTGGTAFATQPVVKIQDAGGNTVIADSSTSVTLTIATGGAGGLSCSPTQVAAGIATFAGCAIDVAGTYTLTATDGLLTSPVASGSVVISVGSFVQIGFSPQPVGALQFSLLAVQPRVTAQDAGGNTVTSVTTGTVTLSLIGEGGETLACTGGLSHGMTAGVAQFAGCYIDLPGTLFISAARGDDSATSDAVTILTGCSC